MNGRTRVVAIVLCIGLLLSSVRVAEAYTPEDPVVQAACEKAVNYLSKAQTGTGAANEAKLGGQALVALAIYKYYRKFGGSYNAKDHPKVKAALQRCKSVAGNAEALSKEDNYSVGISLIFLTEVDYASGGNAIRAYLQEFLKRQKSNGGWGYPNAQQGDISQTQYAVLGLWSALNAGVPLGTQQMEKVAAFLIRVQDPNGGWGYQAIDPGNYTKKSRQQDITASRAAAGLGSLYVAADFLGFSKTKEEDEDKKYETIWLPPALIPVIDEDEDPAAAKKRKRIRLRSNMDYGLFQQAFTSGNEWMSKAELRAKDWQYYYMYATERYESFRELVEGYYVEEPGWYNRGVDFLRQQQDASGYFRRGGEENGGLQVDTAFAVLFLLRSTRDTITRIVKNKGTLRGGYGLPEDVSEVRLSADNKIKAPKVAVEMDDIMSLLEEEENAAQFDDMIKNPDAYSVGNMSAEKSQQYTARLRRIMRSGSYQARIVAARILGRQGDLDNVPILIYGLTDPDNRVSQASRDGLRLTSRRFDGFGMPDSPKPEDRIKAVALWKNWFRGIRPDAGFIEVGAQIGSASRKSGTN